MLIVVGGLPGVGKSHLAKEMACRLRAVYLRIDTIEQALIDSGAPEPLGPAGYVVAYRLAAENLRAGLTVVADCVNPLSITRKAWRDEYEPWDRQPMVIDTATQPLESCVRELLSRLPV